MNDILAGINLFNDADFFAAHDFFEGKWVQCSREDRLFFQGLVQVSVGCYHLVCGNYRGALSQFIKGTQKLKNYLPSHKSLELRGLLLSVNSLINDLNLYSEESSAEIDLNKIPKMKLL